MYYTTLNVTNLLKQSYKYNAIARIKKKNANSVFYALLSMKIVLERNKSNETF